MLIIISAVEVSLGELFVQVTHGRVGAVVTDNATLVPTEFICWRRRHFER